MRNWILYGRCIYCTEEFFNGSILPTILYNILSAIVDGNVKEEREYRGRLHGSFSGVGSDLITIMTLLLKY